MATAFMFTENQRELAIHLAVAATTAANYVSVFSKDIAPEVDSE